METPSPETPVNPADLPETDSLITALHDDIHEAIRRIDTLATAQAESAARLEQLVESHNKVGANIAWIVSNVEGIFKMFSDPAAMSNIMNAMMPMMGGVINGGQEGRGNSNP